MRVAAWSLGVLVAVACSNSGSRSTTKASAASASAHVEAPRAIDAAVVAAAPAPEPEPPAIAGAAWVLTIDGPGTDAVTAFEADARGGVIVLGRYEVYTRIGHVEIANPAGDRFEQEAFVASLSAQGKPSWTTRLGGASYPTGALRAVAADSHAAVIPSYSADGKRILVSVSIKAGQVEPRPSLATVPSPLGTMAVGDDFLFTSGDHGGDGLLVGKGGSRVEVPSPESIARNGRVIAGSYYQEWRAGGRRFKDTGCREEETDGCSQAYVLALDQHFKPRWSLALGVPMADESARLVAANDSLDAAVVVSTAHVDNDALDGTKLLRLSNTGKKLWEYDDAGDISDMRLLEDGTLVVVQARAGDVSVIYFDQKGTERRRAFKLSGHNESPKIAITPTGELYLAWHRSDGPHGQYVVVMRAENVVKQ